MQGLNDIDLKYLGRLHNSSDTFNILDLIKKIDNISVDLIYALTCQNLETWSSELQVFLNRFSIKHLSAYQLVIEKGTKFYDLFNKGELETVSDNTYKKFYFNTKNILKENKFDQYEISNFRNQIFIQNTIQFTGNLEIGLALVLVQLVEFGIKEKKE